MVGLDAAGKTTILYKLKLGEIVTTIPTIGKRSLFLRIWNPEGTLLVRGASTRPASTRTRARDDWPAFQRQLVACKACGLP